MYLCHLKKKKLVGWSIFMLKLHYNAMHSLFKGKKKENRKTYWRRLFLASLLNESYPFSRGHFQMWKKPSSSKISDRVKLAYWAKEIEWYRFVNSDSVQKIEIKFVKIPGILELRPYENDLTEPRSRVVLKLPRFSLVCVFYCRLSKVF